MCPRANWWSSTCAGSRRSILSSTRSAWFVAEQALAEADRVDRSAPLAGVPLAVKDDIDLAGETPTRGSRSFGPPATADAEPIRRLRAAGAIPVGVTNVPEP